MRIRGSWCCLCSPPTALLPTTANDCQVTVEALARDCEIDERTVQRALRSLSQRQLIAIRLRFRNGLN